MTNRTDYINEARAKYDAYDTDEWIKQYFDFETGGYNVYHKQHNFSKAGGGGKAEKTVGVLLAKNDGKQIEFLPEGGVKSPDVKFDGKTWDIKYIDIANQQSIRNDIKDARKADNVIFYFMVENQYDNLLNAIRREVGRFEKNNKIGELPDIYYIGGNRKLNLAWENKKRLNKIAPF